MDGSIMAIKPLPSQEVLEQLLRYEPETGKLFWRERGPEWFSNGRRSAAQWNTRWAGEEAGFSSRGYLRISIGDDLYQAHRLIFKMMVGTEPDQIDHIDGNRANNRWANLRDVSGEANSRNQKLRKTNTSGATGIRFENGVWVAKIHVGGKSIYIGFFDTFEAAKAARAAANIKYGYSERHGSLPDTELR